MTYAEFLASKARKVGDVGPSVEVADVGITAWGCWRAG